MAKKRFEYIDFLRAIAIIGMIATHVLSYNLGTNLVNSIWNYLHFVVPLFVFCSGYVMFRQYSAISWTPGTLIPWYKRRVVRLILPYYAFTLIHYILWFILPEFVSGLGLSTSPRFILSILVFNGVDYGWLPILFLELMIVTPLLLSIRKNRTLMKLTTLIILSSMMYLLFFRALPIDYRLYMWIPWTAILLLSFAAASSDEHKVTNLRLYGGITLIIFALFALGNRLLPEFGMPLTLTLHKYPPDIFYLSYGVGMGSLLLIIERLGVFHRKIVQNCVRWISVRSYELFFVHYIVIDSIQTFQRIHAVELSIGWQLLLSLTISVLVMRLYELVNRHVAPRYSGK